MTESKRKVRTNRNRPGAYWRLLVHDMEGKRSNGKSHNIYSDQSGADRASQTHAKLSAAAAERGLTYPTYADHLVMPNTEFDELVVGKWLHIEQMGDLDYWMSIGGLTVNVTCNRDGTPKLVRYELDEPIEGVEYA